MPTYTNKGFTGQYADAVTGLDYYNARYYDPVAGVFLSVDSVQGNMQGMNPYGYVGGNPETDTDPTGKYYAPPGGPGGPPPPCNQSNNFCNTGNGNNPNGGDSGSKATKKHGVTILNDGYNDGCGSLSQQACLIGQQRRSNSLSVQQNSLAVLQLLMGIVTLGFDVWALIHDSFSGFANGLKWVEDLQE